MFIVYKAYQRKRRRTKSQLQYFLYSVFFQVYYYKMDEYDMDVMNNLNQMVNNNNIQNQRIIEMIGLMANQKRKYKVQKRINPFEIYDDNEFKGRFRLRKSKVEELFGWLDGANTLDPMVI